MHNWHSHDDVGPRVPETARRRRSCLIGACPTPVSLACFYHSSVLFACVCAWCRRRSQWKCLARRPLIWPCKVSGARLMKTLLYIHIYHILSKTIRVGLRQAGIQFIFSYDFFSFCFYIVYSTIPTVIVKQHNIIL